MSKNLVKPITARAVPAFLSIFNYKTIIPPRSIDRSGFDERTTEPGQLLIHLTHFNPFKKRQTGDALHNTLHHHTPTHQTRQTTTSNATESSGEVKLAAFDCLKLRTLPERLWYGVVVAAASAASTFFSYSYDTIANPFSNGFIKIYRTCSASIGFCWWVARLIGCIFFRCVRFFFVLFLDLHVSSLRIDEGRYCDTALNQSVTQSA